MPLGVLVPRLLLLALFLSPLLYVIHRARGRRPGELAALCGLVAGYVVLYRRFVFAREYVFHDTLWNHHAFYAILAQWLENGHAVGWNPFLNGGEPLYVFSNFFLWAEFVAFALVNTVLRLPVHDLINLYFTFVLLSFALFCFLLFSALFRDRLAAFYALIPVLFGGLSVSTFGQYVLSPLYLLPLALLAAFRLVRERRAIWLWALGFLVAVSANHYLPHYLVLSVGALLLGWAIVAGARRLAGGSRGDEGPGRSRALPWRSPRRLAAGLGLGALLLAAAAPAVFVHLEVRDHVSPTRGNTSLAGQGIGLQPGVSLGPVQYRHLVTVPRIDPGDASWQNLAYNHSVFYIGWLPVLLAALALATPRHREHWPWLLALLGIAVLALGDRSPVWVLLREHVPLFYPRHAYPLALTVTLLIVVLSGFGFERLPLPARWKLGLCGVVLALSVTGMWRAGHADTREDPPFEIRPFAYPTERLSYAEPLARVPLDSGSITGKHAAATHRNEDFLLLRSRAYDALVRRDLPLASGPIFGFSTRLEVPGLSMDGVASEIDNGSFERWTQREGTGASGRAEPAGLAFHRDQGEARLEENRDHRFVLDGSASARLDLRAGSTARLNFEVPGVGRLRGRFAWLSVCLASPGSVPVGLRLTVLQENGFDILIPHTHAGGGRWDCVDRTIKVHEGTSRMSAALSLSALADATVFLDRVQLRIVPEAQEVRERAIPVTLLEATDPNRVVVRAEIPADGYLVRKENFHRGWSARVDGAEAPIERYAGVFQAVRVMPGTRVIEFRFRSAYSALMWGHVAAVLVGYAILFGAIVVSAERGAPVPAPARAARARARWLTAASRRSGAIEAAVFLAGVLVLIACQWPALVSGRTTLRHDHLYWGVPVYSFFFESLRHGQLPLWNPFTHGGEPFYLPLFQLRLLDPVAGAVALAGKALDADAITLYGWDRFGRGIVIAAGCHLLLRLWARHLLTRLVLIPILLFSSAQWALVRQMALAEQFLLTPLVALFLLRIVYWRDHRWRSWLAGALLFGLNFQTYFFTGTAVFVSAALVGLALFNRRLLARAWRRRGLLPRLGVAAAITAVMLAPSVVLLREAPRFIFPPRVVDYAYENLPPQQGPTQYEPRGKIRWERPLLFPYALQFHVGTFSAPDDFIQMLAPLGSEYARSDGQSWGKPSEAFVYVGMLPFCVALLGLVAGRHRLRRMWITVLVTSGLLALGPQGFLHALLYWVFPPLWFLRNTHTLTPLFVLALLYFFVLGCERLLSARAAPLFAASRPDGPLARALRMPALARALAVAAAVLAVAATVVVTNRLKFPFRFYLVPVLALLGVLVWILRRDLGQRGLYWAVLIGYGSAVGTLAFRARDRTSVLFLAIFLGLPLLVWVCWPARRRRLARTGLVLAALATGGAAIHRLFAMAAQAAEGSLRPTPGYALALVGGLLGAVLLALALVDAYRRSPPMLSRSRLVALLAVMTAVDLLAYSGYVKGLVEGERPDRFVSVVPASTRRTLPATREVAPAVPPLSAYGQTIRYLDVLARRPAAFSPFFAGAEPVGADQGDDVAKIAALLRADRASTFLLRPGYYGLLESGAPAPVLAEIFAIGRPLVQFRPDWLWLSSREALGVLNDPFAPEGHPDLFRAAAILEPDPAGSGTGGGLPHGDAGASGEHFEWRVKSYRYHALSLAVTAPARGVLYWADGYDSRWHAWVDGAEVRVQRANLAFKGILLEPGRHAVRFEFRPTAIVATSLVFVGLGFVGAGMTVWALCTSARTSRRRERGASPPAP